MLLRKKVIVFARLGWKLKLVQYPPTTDHQFQTIVVPTRYQNLHGQYWAVNMTFIFARKIAYFLSYLTIIVKTQLTWKSTKFIKITDLRVKWVSHTLYVKWALTFWVWSGHLTRCVWSKRLDALERLNYVIFTLTSHWPPSRSNIKSLEKLHKKHWAPSRSNVKFFKKIPKSGDRPVDRM